MCMHPNSSKCPLILFSSFIVPVQGGEPRASWVPGWHSTTELQSQPQLYAAYYTLMKPKLKKNVNRCAYKASLDKKMKTLGSCGGEAGVQKPAKAGVLCMAPV